MPYLPLSIVARINNFAKKELLSNKTRSLDPSDIEDIRVHTGFRDNLRVIYLFVIKERFQSSHCLSWSQ